MGTLQAPAISISAAGDPADSGTFGLLRLRASQAETRTLLVYEAADPRVGLKVLGFGFWSCNSRHWQAHQGRARETH